MLSDIKSAFESRALRGASGGGIAAAVVIGLMVAPIIPLSYQQADSEIFRILF